MKVEARRGGKTALLIDDNPAIRKILMRVFLSNGFKTCIEVETGKEGIELAQQTRPDVIILDFAMPGMNGLQAAAELRKLHPTTPIILFTLYGDGPMSTEASKVGINLVVPKTMPPAMLLDRVHELMGD